jgi:glyoxylase-like metal-dependent hydrolase (beta-lactamase superfamily II)
MKICLIVVALVACAGPRFEELGSATPELHVERIELVWSNVYLVTKGDAAILIDSGSPQDKDALDTALAARHVTPRAVVLTHVHADHAGLAHHLQARGAKIILGAADVAVAARDRNDPLPATGLLGGWLAPLFMFEREPFTPDMTIDHEVDLADFGFPDLHVVPAPGHTPGSLVVVAGTDAFTGDLFKGGYFARYFVTRPSEHYYQADPVADHRAVTALLDRGVTRFYLGHGGPAAADDVRAWVATADDATGSRIASMQIALEGGSGGGTTELDSLFRFRYGVGRTLGYIGGLDLRGGVFGTSFLEADAHVVGAFWRASRGDVISLTSGIGFGGLHGTRTTDIPLELSVDVPLGPVHMFEWFRLAWQIGGTPYPAKTSLGIGDEMTDLFGVRLGRDRHWGKVLAGLGPYLAARLDDIGGTKVYGLALGLDLWAGD